MEYTPIWSGIIACYLFLGGLGGGAFATSAFLAWRHPEAVTMRKLGHWIAPIVVIVGLVLLMFDAKAGLHNPLRFALLLTNFGSVMTWGVVILAAFVIVALVALIMDLKKRRVPMWLEIVGAVLGICVAIYTGCLLGVCKTFPLWNNALLPILFLVSAVSTGMAAVLLAGVFKCPEEFNRVGVLKKFHFCFPCIEMLLVAALLFITATNSTAGLASVQALVCGKYAVVFWVLFVAVGLVIPTVLETKMLFFSPKEFEESRKAHMISAGSDIGVLVGGFVLRLLVLLAALPLILNLYTLSPASRELATQLVFIHDGFAMLLWPLALSMPNALRAANDVKFTMVLSIGSMVCFRIALSYIVGVKMGYGALGVWFAMLVDWLFRAAVYTWRFEKGKWENMARI